jgi:N-acetylornithine carbamoyltransferase
MVASDASTDEGVRHFTRLEDFSTQELRDVLDLARRLKQKPARADLSGRSIGMLFFRGSLRTRASVESAMNQLGGSTIHLAAMSDFWELEVREGRVMDGRAPEHIRDAAAALSSYVQALAVRPPVEAQSWAVDRQDAHIRAWARHSRVPVINMESAMWHPLQGLADLMTLHAHLGELRGKRLTLAWVHSPQPSSAAVAHSLLMAAARFGMDVTVARPKGFELDGEVVADARREAEAHGASIAESDELPAAVEGANVVYARSWQSLGDYDNPTLAATRRARFKDWRVDETLLKRGADCRLMHAMPVRRNVEVTDEVLDGPRSLVLEQAENRMHSAKALLLRLLKPHGGI